MTKRGEIYRCEVCGNIIEVINEAKGELVCCGKPMKLLEEKTADSSTEKHAPFVKKEGDIYIIKIGENTNHPMEKSQKIQWIEIITQEGVMRRYLDAGDEPQAEFKILEEENIIAAREYCNIHGLWLNKY